MEETMRSSKVPTAGASTADWSGNAHWSQPSRARSVALPESRLLALALPRVDWYDAYALSFPTTPPGQPQQWADAIFRAPPPWISVLFAIREGLVRLVGIERGGRHVFDAVAVTDNEVLLGTDQKHLSFRASVLVEPSRVVLSTVVQVHNRRGRLYSALVRLFHPVVVRTLLTRAGRRIAGNR
jgi:Protein of unknown function (DUF2867)